MALYEIEDPGPLRRPVLIVAMEGWVNAGEAGTIAAKVLAGPEAEEIAEFDPDALFDYKENRPTIDFVEGVMQSVVWPRLVLTRSSYTERDVLCLVGAEPNQRWRRLGTELASLARELGVEEEISVGGLPWTAPHTRPVSTIVTASHPDRVGAGDAHPEGLLRVPGAAVSALERFLVEAGIPTVGFWARVPQYIGVAFHAAALALVEKVAAYVGVSVDIRELAELANEQRVHLDAIADARSDIKSMVSQLESVYDTEGGASGEQLAAEIERFLRERGGEEGIGG